MTISFTVNASRDYLAKIHFTSSHLFGTYDSTIPVTYTGVTDLSTILGVITLGDVTLSVANFIFTIILWGVFMLFSKDNAEIGIIVGIGIGFLFSWLGWITFSASLLNLMYACILIAVLELMRKKEMGF
jgi:membrane-associated protease RseP (regulator of RpoE activity)